jgi:hypothetical protein
MVGYGTEILEGINVTPGTVSNGSVTLTEQALAVEGITVTSQRREIDVTDASVVQYVERQQIEELPSRGRDFTDFINLSGLVAPDPGGPAGLPDQCPDRRGRREQLVLRGEPGRLQGAVHVLHRVHRGVPDHHERL